MAEIVLEEKSAIDKLAEGSISESLEEPTPKIEETKVEEPKVDYEARLKQLEDQLTESRQEQQFLRGYLAKRDEKKEDKPAPLAEPEYNYDEITKDIETRGSQALIEQMKKIAQHEREKVLREVDERLNGKLGQRDAVANRRQAFQNEIDQIAAEYGDIYKDEAFKAEADKICTRTLALRLGREPNYAAGDAQYFQPGDLYSAATLASVRLGKVGGGEVGGKQPQTNANGSSLREITRRVPKSDDLGSGNGGRNASKMPKSIDEIDMPAREREAAKRVFRKLQELNPQLTEQSWIENYNAGAREAADNA